MKKTFVLLLIISSLGGCELLKLLIVYKCNTDSLPVGTNGGRWETNVVIPSNASGSKRITSLTYKCSNCTAYQLQGIREAINEVKQSTCVAFQERASNAPANITITFSDTYRRYDDTKASVSSIPFAKNEFGYANYPKSRVVNLEGTVYLNSNINWVNDDLPDFEDAVDLVTIAAHELLHALGIPHSDDENSLMFKTSNRSIRQLTGTDIKNLRSLYNECL